MSKRKVWDLLIKKDHGITVEQIAEETRMTRKSVREALSRLVNQDYVMTRDVLMIKRVYAIKTKWRMSNGECVERAKEEARSQALLR